MQLTQDQIQSFDRDGYLFFPAVFDAGEVARLRDDLPALLARQGPEVVREREDASAVRLVYGSHVFSEAYRRLSLHPRLLGPVRQLLREDCYIHQSRLNPKQDFGGGTWTWHQDFGTWHRVDAMAAPKCVMTAVFLDEANAANAPLLIVPGSQHHGLIEDATPDAEASGYALMEIDRATLERLVAEGGLEALTGPAGSVAFLHCNIVHGSSNNITPWRRAIFYLNYNAVSNACGGRDRAWHHCNRDATPLQPLADDCLTAATVPA
jgi:ectoine hydroxylase